MNRLSILLGIVTLGFVVAVPSSAVAHADLASSNPADGSSVETMPAEVSLTFSGVVQEPARVAVAAADGARMNSFDIEVRDDTVTSVINQPAPAGVYTVTYQAVSADGDPVSGSATFTVLTGPEPTAGDGASPTPSPQATPDDVILGQPQVKPASDGSSTARDALTILGFSVITMGGFVLVLRAGLRSANGGDDD